MGVGELKVKDAMTKRIATINKDETVRAAAVSMKKWRVGSLVVVSDKTPVGIVTESDIIKKVVSNGLTAGNIAVGEIMSKPVKFITPDERLSDAAKRMTTGRIRRMPVMDRGELVGILTHTDIVRVSPALIDILSERIRMRDEDRQFSGENNSGLCESCGNFSDNLVVLDDEWVCGDCKEEKQATQTQ